MLLEASIKHHPTPVKAAEYRVPKLWHGDLESKDGKSLVTCDPKGNVFFVIVKVMIDPQAGEISIGRLFSGTMAKGTDVNLLRAKERGRVQQVFIMNGPKREIVDSVPAGNIIAIAGIKSAPGETITTAGPDAEPFEELTHIFEPVVTKSIEAKKPSDLPKLIEVLRQVAKEDPSIRIAINEETGEHLMSGMGELHLEVIENRIKTEKNVEVQMGPPIVVYREAITKLSTMESEGKSPNKHNRLYFVAELIPEVYKNAIKRGDVPEGRVKSKDTSIRDKFMELGMDAKIAAKVKDIYEGNMFIDQTRGIVHIGEIMELVLDMFEDVMRQGPLAREPCLNMIISLTDCKLHEDAIHRGPSQMYPAVREGIRGAIANASPLLLEPVQLLQLESPDEYMGELSKIVNNKRGQLLDMQQEGTRVIVKAKLPVAEMFGMSNDLRSATGGRGNFFVQDQMFERLPMELQEKIRMQIRNRKGLSEAQ